MNTNQQVMELLGLGHVRRVIAADISLRLNSLPTVKLTCFLPDAPTQTHAQHFTLQATEVVTQSTDIDAMCFQALRRLHAQIDRSAALHKLEMDKAKRPQARKHLSEKLKKGGA